MKNWLSLVVISTLLFSCGSKEKNTPIDNRIELENDDELRAALAESSVTCMESSCPSNVAKLAFWQRSSESEEGYSFGVCSGTLVDETTVVTNSHCIPEEISYNGANCNGQVLVQFPEDYNNGREAESVDCLKVEEVHDYLNGGPDIAIIKVKKSRYYRESARIAPNKMNDRGKVFAYTMNPSQGRNRFAGYIYKKSCSISQTNILTGHLSSASSDALITGWSCDVISGNSGSGVFNSRGEFIGVVHSKIDVPALKSAFRSAGIEFNSLSKMGMLVNIGCSDSIRSCITKGLSNQNLNDYISSVKRRAGLDSYDDADLKARLGSQLEITLSPYPQSSSQYPWMRRDSLVKMRNGLEKIYLEDTEEVKSWAQYRLY